jgi:solute carrier family 38 (sodium-coupled neutral amino acid transporter), member 11
VIEQYFFSHESFNQQRHIFFTTTILFASMLSQAPVLLSQTSLIYDNLFPVVALVTCDLGVMLEITGGLSATTLAFIFPAACYLKLTDSQTPWHSRAKLPAIACVAFGIVVMTISLFLALNKVWTSEGDAKLCM